MISCFMKSGEKSHEEDIFGASSCEFIVLKRGDSPHDLLKPLHLYDKEIIELLARKTVSRSKVR